MIATIAAVIVGLVLAGLFAYLDFFWIRRISNIISDASTARAICDENRDSGNSYVGITWHKAGIKPKSRSMARLEYLSLCEDGGLVLIEVIGLVFLVGLQVSLSACAVSTIAYGIR